MVINYTYNIASYILKYTLSYQLSCKQNEQVNSHLSISLLASVSRRLIEENNPQMLDDPSRSPLHLIFLCWTLT